MCWQRQKCNEKSKRVCILLWLWWWRPTKLPTWQRAYFMSQASWSVRSRASVPVHCLLGWWVLKLTFVGSLSGTTHHFFFFLSIWTLRCIGHLGLWHTNWRTQQNKDLNAARWYTFLPDHLLCSTIVFFMYLYISLVGGGREWLFVCEGRSKR